MTPEALGTYEDGRVPLTWRAFLKLWRKFSISPRWLAAGEGAQKFPSDDLAQLLSAQISRRAHFSDVYAQHLAPIFAELEQRTRPHHVRELERFWRTPGAARQLLPPCVPWLRRRTQITISLSWSRSA